MYLDFFTTPTFSSSPFAFIFIDYLLIASPFFSTQHKLARYLFVPHTNVPIQDKCVDELVQVFTSIDCLLCISLTFETFTSDKFFFNIYIFKIKIYTSNVIFVFAMICILMIKS